MAGNFSERRMVASPVRWINGIVDRFPSELVSSNGSPVPVTGCGVALPLPHSVSSSVDSEDCIKYHLKTHQMAVLKGVQYSQYSKQEKRMTISLDGSSLTIEKVVAIE